MRAIVAAHRWGSTLAIAVTLALIGVAFSPTVVSLPFLQLQVPARLLVAIGAVLVSVTPLYATFGDLVATLWREPQVRLLRPLGTIGLALLAFVPALLCTPSPDTDTEFFLVMLALGLLSVAVLGDLAWTTILTLGFLALVLDATPGSPVQRFLFSCDDLVLVAVVAASAAVVGIKGPRRWRSLE